MVKPLFYNDPDRMILIQPAPWSRCCVLGRGSFRSVSLLGGFEQAVTVDSDRFYHLLKKTANLRGKEVKKSTGKLEVRSTAGG